MAWVYILRGSSGRHYIGSTDDFERRFAEHCRGNNHTTHRLGELEIVVVKKISSKAAARRMELALKRKKNPQLAILTLRSHK